jgi:hypothetical protein
MMKKKDVYTNITALPSFIPRQLALDILHSHSEIITLNPLVIEHHAIPAPRDAPAEEYYSSWYEISERLQFVPGIGKLGAGKLTFRGCFHDVPWGVQTHIYVPMGVDLRHNYRIAGNQPGEPPEHRELGIGAPASGLYLREDIEVRCNITMISFVKSNLKSATKVLVDRLIKKAELLDAGHLKAMMENGKLKTINPADRTARSQQQQQQQQQQHSPLPSPLTNNAPPQYQVPQSPRPEYQTEQKSYYAPPQIQQQQQQQHAPPTGNSFAMELPGDTYYYQKIPSPNLQPPNHYAQRDSTISNVSNPSSTGSWSGYPGTAPDSRPSSFSPSMNSGLQSPPPDKQFATELPAMQETREEYRNNNAGMWKSSGGPTTNSNSFSSSYQTYQSKGRYNPQDYADVSTH